MIRILALLIVLGLVAIGLAWVADRPGDIVLTWQGTQYQMSLLVGVLLVAVAAVAVAILWWLLRLIVGAPRRASRAAKRRRREKGLDAVSRGLVAAGAGDLRNARRAAEDARRHVGDAPLAMLLDAQVAQLAGDRNAAQAAFARMAEHEPTRLLGLRGLHHEARRAGRADVAHLYAEAAHATTPVAWAGRALLAHHAGATDWQQALAVVDTQAKAHAIDRPTADRQRAVLQTALADTLRDRDPDEALRLTQESLKTAPDLVPARALAGRLLARKGELKRGAKLIERGWKKTPHPDLARAYVDMRPGDSTGDRLERAETLAALWPDHAESRLMLARTAMDARHFARARRELDALVSGSDRPTVRACLLMAELEEAEHGATAAVRFWLARAARAPRDPAWIADGVVSDVWEPVSPVTGRVDAFVWQAPPEQTLGAAEPAWMPESEPKPQIAAPTPSLVPAPAPIEPPAPIEAPKTPAPAPEPASLFMRTAPAAPAPPAPRPEAAPEPAAPEPPTRPKETPIRTVEPPATAFVPPPTGDRRRASDRVTSPRAPDDPGAAVARAEGFEA